MSDQDNFGTVYVPKSLVEEDKEFYKDSDLVEVTPESLMELNCLLDEEAQEEFDMYEFEEPMMFKNVRNRIYINSWDLRPAEVRNFFTREEIADYEGLRYEDCDQDYSSWSDG